MRTILVLCWIMSGLGFVARAASVDDVIAMTQKGESEAKQILAVDNTPGEINVGASDVLRLREAKVPEKVIVALLRHVPKDAAAANTPTLAAPSSPVAEQSPRVQVPAPRPPAAVPQRSPADQRPIADQRPAAALAPAAIRNPNQDGMVTIENLDDRPWSYMYEPAIQTIWVAFPSQGSVIQAHCSLTLSMHSGNYKVRFSGTQTEGFPLAVNGGERAALNISRTNENGTDIINVSMFENGERRASGKLAALASTPAPTQTVVERQYVESPVYYSSPPVYYAPYYSGGYYRPYYGGAQFNFNFGGGHRR